MCGYVIPALKKLAEARAAVGVVVWSGDIKLGLVLGGLIIYVYIWVIIEWNKRVFYFIN